MQFIYKSCREGRRYEAFHHSLLRTILEKYNYIGFGLIKTKTRDATSHDLMTHSFFVGLIHKIPYIDLAVITTDDNYARSKWWEASTSDHAVLVIVTLENRDRHTFFPNTKANFPVLTDSELMLNFDKDSGFSTKMMWFSQIFDGSFNDWLWSIFIE